MILSLERPLAAMPSSYLWTWDHSTNWVLDDEGMLTFGCANRHERMANIAAGRREDLPPMHLWHWLERLALEMPDRHPGCFF